MDTASSTGSRVLAPLARRVAAAHTAPRGPRDPRLVQASLGVMGAITTWFSPVIHGTENIPRSGPVLVVANHSCLIYMPDAGVVLQTVVRHRGPDAPTYTLTYDLLFTVPGLGGLIRRLGFVPADPGAALDVLHQGGAVVVFPGGDHDACRPWSERDRIAFGTHRGYVRLALRAGVPVVPAVAHGAHHGMLIVARGEPLAAALRLPDVRVKVLPFLLGPAGVLPVLAPPPLPARITVEFLPALDWSAYPAEAADDDEVVETCHDEVVRLMQSSLDRLAREHPHPVSEGLGALAARGLHRVSR
jgi:1-acyl-sn-glycerol-3-phosphate acyltransferase